MVDWVGAPGFGEGGGGLGLDYGHFWWEVEGSGGGVVVVVGGFVGDCAVWVYLVEGRATDSRSSISSPVDKVLAQ